MKRSLVVLAVLVCFVLTFGAFSIAKAETILFPVIAINQPNVTTIVSVMNWSSTATHMHYTYRYKDSLVGGSPNYTGGCSTTEFTRPTHDDDLVSFDASGTLNSGNALFNDPDSYGGSFGLSVTGPRRAYLLVTHSNASGTRVDTGELLLGGEAIVMDIAYGAAWGYKAVNDLASETYSFINYYDRGGSGAPGVFSSISIGMGFGSPRQLTFLPPNEWTTKFFVTPIGGSMTSDRTAEIQFIFLYDRTGTSYSIATKQSVTCTAAVDLEDLIDSTVWSSIQNMGGWGAIFPPTGDMIVYKLEYVVNNPTYGGTNNNGFLLSTYDWF
jgi:hypothetical protein